MILVMSCPHIMQCSQTYRARSRQFRQSQIPTDDPFSRIATWIHVRMLCNASRNPIPNPSQLLYIMTGHGGGLQLHPLA